MRVLVDAGILTHAEFAERATQATPFRYSNGEIVLVHGIKRKKPEDEPEYQRQIDALFTVGRLIREGRIAAYDYTEIRFEAARVGAGIQAVNALRGCTIQRCAPALERSRFARTSILQEMFAKGGSKDRKTGIPLGGANQIAFMEFLCQLGEEHVKELTEQHSALLRLTDFEIKSLRNLHWFQFLCERSDSRENYPDVFHMWTAERNGLDAFLTLEKKFVNFICRVRNEKKKRIEIRTEVLRPLELLQKFGIEKPDPVPMQARRFYYWHEVT